MIDYPELEILDFKVDIDKIIQEIESKIFTYEKFEDQINLQIVPGIRNPFYGSRKGDELKHKEIDFTEYFFDMPYTNSVLKKFDLVRCRVMYMKPKTCLSVHVDPTRRLHIPLVSSDDCFFVINNKIYRMPNDGSVYLMNAKLPHTAVNASFAKRLHLVGVYLE